MGSSQHGGPRIEGCRGLASVHDGVCCTTYSNQYDRFSREIPAAKLVRNPGINFVQDGKIHPTLR